MSLSNNSPIIVPGYNNYFGGKSGMGTYQTQINLIPPIDTFISGCLGLCAVTRYMKPAAFNILNDMDTALIASWKNAIIDHNRYMLTSLDVTELIRSVIAEKYDTAAALLYLDPPYRFVTRKSQRPVYKFEMKDAQHVALLEAATSLKAIKTMICHYPNDMYDEYLRGWNTLDFYSQTRSGLALERVYYNYELTDQRHDYRYIGNDFREREKLNRIKRNYLAKLKRLDPLLRNAILNDIASHKNAI